MKSKLAAILGLIGWLAAGMTASAAGTLTKVEVSPADVNLKTARDYQTLVVQAFYSDGLTRDVTEEAKFSLANPAFAKLQGAKLEPVADGATELKVEFGGKTLVVPVKVEQAATDRPISFRLDVMPVFLRAGCNTGSCHGAARGKDGFRISLFGFDPEHDYFSLTRQLSGRRINLAIPAESLVIEKSIGKVQHTGGTLFKPGSHLYNTLLRWLEAGAPNDGAEVAKPVGIEVYPRNGVLDGEGATQRLVVRAKYSDGTDRDVTNLAMFRTSNESSGKVSEDGVVRAGQRGEAFIFARFDNYSVGSQFIVLPKGLQYTRPSIPQNNYIDALVHDKLDKLRIIPAEVCSDEVFLRRVFIDVTGVLPTVEEYNRFMASKDPKKREQLVDELLNRKEFVEVWVMKFAELLQIRSTQQVSYKSTLLYYNWLQERLAGNVPMNKIVQELLATSGGTFKNPATNYYQIETDTLKVSENVAQVFMGMRTQCAQCHNHPFDRWTMDDYYSFAAFFTQIGRKQAEDPRETIVFNRNSGEINHPVGGRAMTPKFLGGAVPEIKGRDRREVMAEWLASPENPFFAKNLANIVWAHFYGRGIVDPVDDVRVTNPASNPELLEELGKRFTAYNYDFKKLVRDICTSRTYQLSTQVNDTNKLDESNFSRAYIRRIKAEVFLDVLTQVTEGENKFRGLPKGARAVQIADGAVSTYFLETFGRATRLTVCSCEVKMEPNLSQALHLLNGSITGQTGKVINKAFEEKKTPEQIFEETSIRCVSRKPTEKEKAALMAELKDEKQRKEVLNDIFWALLNSKEFLFNH